MNTKYESSHPNKPLVVLGDTNPPKICNLKSIICNKKSLSILTASILLLLSISPLSAQEPSNELKLRWFDVFYSSQNFIPRQHFLILLQSSLDQNQAPACQALVFPKGEAWEQRSAMTREQLIGGVLKIFPQSLYQRGASKVFADLPGTYAWLEATDWFFRSQLNPPAWADMPSLNAAQTLTYAEAMQFAEQLKALLNSDRPRLVSSYIAAPPPPSAGEYFELRLSRDKKNSLIELAWRDQNKQRPELVTLNLSSWKLLDQVLVYDDGTYGDRKENDGIYGFLVSSAAIPERNGYVDVQFNSENGSDVYGRLNLP